MLTFARYGFRGLILHPAATTSLLTPLDAARILASTDLLTTNLLTETAHVLCSGSSSRSRAQMIGARSSTGLRRSFARSRHAAWCSLAYLQLKDQPTAIEALKHSLDLAPFGLVVLYALPQILVYEDRIDEAIDVLRSGIGRFPTDERLRILLLNVLQHHVGDVEAARLALESAHAAIPGSMAREPDHPDLFSGLVALLTVKGDVVAARTTAKEWIARHPGGEEHHVCARLVADQKLRPLLDDALDWAHDAAAALPLASGARITLARLLLAKGRFGDALASVAALLDNPPVIRKKLGEFTALLVELSAAAETRDVLAAIESSKSAGALEALLVALRRMEGLEVNPPKEVSEVALDIQRQIERLRPRPVDVTAAVESPSEAPRSAPPGRPGTRRRRAKPA